MAWPTRIPSHAAARALLGAPTVAAVGLMALNDHVLKGAGLLPGAVTGKLSDFAFLFFAPIVLAFVGRARSRLALAACYALPAALFVAINVSTAASDTLAAAMSLVVPTRLWADAEDLVALAILPASHWYLTRPRPAPRGDRPLRSSLRVLVTAVAAIACLATSPPPRPMPVSHRPLYMSWDELRSTAVRVEPPHPITKRGKMLVADAHLFVNEPGQGVHVFDDRDPKNPVALFFIRIPGNIDIALHDRLLYADSFVDLLTFELDLPARTARLVGRIEDQFAYDPLVSLGIEEQVYLAPLDESAGAVVGIEPVLPVAPGGTP